MQVKNGAAESRSPQGVVHSSAMGDHTQLEVLRHQLAAVADEMGATLQRAAYSTNIKERLDFSCAVFDGRGNLVAQAAHIPVHLGAMPASVTAARKRCPDLGPGDVVVLNDPFAGGSHLPDITTVSPVFAGGQQLIGYVATRAHHADVGGAAPGSMPLVRELYAEGLVIPPLRLVKGGSLNVPLFELIAANSRTPEERRGDLEAQLAAHRRGAQQLQRLADRPQELAADCQRLLDYSEHLTRQRLAQLRPGSYRFEDVMDGDGFQEAPVPIRVAVTIGASGDFHADFTGTAGQTQGGINAPLAVTHSAVYYVLACLLGDVPVNAGLFAPVTVTAPLGSLLNPRPPAAVAAGNVETSQRIVDVLLGALQPAAADRIPAASAGTMNNLALGTTAPGSATPFTYYETLGGGAGAGPHGPGASGLQVHMTNTRNTPVEALEIAYPLRVCRYGLRRDSGGAGLHGGGAGVVRHLQFLADAQLTLVTDRRTHPPWGLAGGAAGAPGECWLIRDGRRQRLPAKVSLAVGTGDEVIVASPGGGGWGAASASLGKHVEDQDEHQAPGEYVQQQ